MAVRISDDARNAAADAIAALLDGGKLRIYSGTQPAGPDTAVTSQTLLAEFSLDDPAFAAADDGTVTMDVDPALTDDGLAAGTAAWFRYVDATEAAGTGLGVVDGSVTATGGGGDLTLNTVTISVGVAVEVTGGTISMPAAAS